MESAANLFDKALKLPLEERAYLAEQLLQSLQPKVEENIDPEWEKELNKRLNEIENGKVNLVSWESIKNKF